MDDGVRRRVYAGRPLPIARVGTAEPPTTTDLTRCRRRPPADPARPRPVRRDEGCRRPAGGRGGVLAGGGGRGAPLFSARQPQSQGRHARRGASAAGQRPRRHEGRSAHPATRCGADAHSSGAGPVAADLARRPAAEAPRRPPRRPAPAGTPGRDRHWPRAPSSPARRRCAVPRAWPRPPRAEAPRAGPPSAWWRDWPSWPPRAPGVSGAGGGDHARSSSWPPSTTTSRTHWRGIAEALHVPVLILALVVLAAAALETGRFVIEVCRAGGRRGARTPSGSSPSGG